VKQVVGGGNGLSMSLFKKEGNGLSSTYNDGWNGLRQHSKKAGKGVVGIGCFFSMFTEVWNGLSSMICKNGQDTSRTGSQSLFKEGWKAGSLERGTVQRRLEQFIGMESHTVMGKRDSKLIELSHVIMGLKIIYLKKSPKNTK
jgi:hypothetical protein